MGVRPYRYEPLAQEKQLREADQNRKKPESDSHVVVDIDRKGNTDWCTCNCCEPMESETESHCCREIPQILAKIYELGLEEATCITTHPGFEGGCLNVWALEIAYLQYRQTYGAMKKAIHEKYRYTAYRQLVRWCWGYLGEKHRVPLPACAVAKIRQQYPKDGGAYKGFQWPNV
ncbi:hypothetical protein LSAT2_027576 [Lamellibrachia satsuma]|nr:hypothetical protein LSAT2_027576 [Lamellibrachia satsuma]